MNKPTITQIFTRFLKLGLTAFGGPAMVPYIRRMAVEDQQWISEESFRLGMSTIQVIPGATAMQIAAYVGLRSRGGFGALAAYVGFGLPAFLLMLGLTFLYATSQDIPAIAAAFSGLQLMVVALVLSAAIDFSRQYLDSMPSKILACTTGIWLGLKGNPILALVVACIISIFLFRNEQGRLVQTENKVSQHPFRAAGILLATFMGFLGFLWFFFPELSDLALLMVKIDCFAFGGGYVSVPIMLHEVVEVRGWLSPQQFMDGIALGQVTPGPIVMTGAFVGYLMQGVAGAVVATISVFTPSLIFVCAATPFADKLSASPIAQRALKGSLITLVGLMAAVAARFGVAMDWGIMQALIALTAFTALRLRIDIIKVVLAGSLISAFIL